MRVGTIQLAELDAGAAAALGAVLGWLVSSGKRRGRAAFIGGVGGVVGWWLGGVVAGEAA